MKNKKLIKILKKAALGAMSSILILHGAPIGVMAMQDNPPPTANTSPPLYSPQQIFERSTGALPQVTQNYAQNLAIADSTGTTRLISTPAYGIDIQILYRPNPQTQFAPAATISRNDTFTNIFFDQNDQYIYAITNINRPRAVLARLDPSNLNVLEVIFEHDRLDVYATFGNTFTPGRPGGVIYHDFLMHRHFLSQDVYEFFTQLYALLPQPSIVTIDSLWDDFNMAAVNVRSDINRGRLYMFDRQQNNLTLLTDRNWGDINHMAPTRPISFTARDGLIIPGYLTLPLGVDPAVLLQTAESIALSQTAESIALSPGTEPANLPLVVMPHGGPHMRDTWGGMFDWIQFLANRGYAVFQPNFRGSTGYGRDFMAAGFNQWGLDMQNDITDGVKHLIDIGIADPTRIAIFGASYGGYAALAAATFTPELYAAVISLAGISNLFTWLEHIPPYWTQMTDVLHYRLGHPIYDEARLQATSPLFHVEHINAPVLIAHGANDNTVPVQESLQMIDAMEAIGREVYHMIFADEGHSLVHNHNKIAFFTMVEAFLARYLGGRTTTTMEELEAQIQAAMIPHNIDGNQGVITHHLDIEEGMIGSFELIFQYFTHGMNSVNAAVVINGREVALGLGLNAGDVLGFYILPEDVGGNMHIRMSTNCVNSGIVHTFIVAGE